MLASVANLKFCFFDEYQYALEFMSFSPFFFSKRTYVIFQLCQGTLFDTFPQMYRPKDLNVIDVQEVSN